MIEVPPRLPLSPFTMRKELRNSNDDLYFTVEADKKSGWIRGCWYGTPTIEQIKSASLLYVDYLQRTPHHKIMNDIRYYVGSFLDANEWLERVCLPPAQQAGLTCIANLVPEELKDRLSVEDLCKRAKNNFRACIFTDEEEAAAWLKECR